MKFAILSATCSWKTAFYEGKSEFATEFEVNGTLKKITIVLESKNGKVSFTVTFADEPDKIIRMWCDSSLALSRIPGDCKIFVETIATKKQAIKTDFILVKQ